MTVTDLSGGPRASDRRRLAPGSWVAVIGCALAVTGCAVPRRDAVPPQLAAAGSHIDLANQCEYRAIDADVLRRLEARPPSGAGPSTSARPAQGLQILCLSGGGKFGAYTVGVLSGWTRSGSRPCFDIVTGVSTGALISTFAYLGPQYDGHAHDLYTNLTTRDVVRRRPLYGVIGANSAYSSAPLARLIDREITDQLLAEVGTAHRAGRRLFVATTNLDTSRAVVWDMGAIAVSTRPDRREHFSKVLLASASIPGALPPVPIQVTVNGQSYTELHGDGGATQELFLRATMLGINAESVPEEGKPLLGSELSIIVAGKLFADPKAVAPRTLGLAAAAASSVLYAQTRNDLIRLYTLSLLTGMNYRFLALPGEVPVSGDSLAFDAEELRRLFAAGYGDGVRQAWRRLPPETEVGEQVVPRKGTDFLAPVIVPQL
jgi:hypothetical protein